MWTSVAFGNALPHTDIDVFLFSSYVRGKDGTFFSLNRLLNWKGCVWNIDIASLEF